MRMRVAIDVMPKREILDPQGKTVEDSLPGLGFAGVSRVRIGKHIECEVEGASREEIARLAEEMTRRFLANPVIEDYAVRVEDAAP
jgi:phosphoribosylformylglycinamidine synthase PurS subunit